MCETERAHRTPACLFFCVLFCFLQLSVFPNSASSPLPLLHLCPGHVSRQLCRKYNLLLPGRSRHRRLCAGDRCGSCRGRRVCICRRRRRPPGRHLQPRVPTGQQQAGGWLGGFIGVCGLGFFLGQELRGRGWWVDVLFVVALLSPCNKLCLPHTPLTWYGSRRRTASSSEANGASTSGAASAARSAAMAAAWASEGGGGAPGVVIGGRGEEGAARARVI